MEDIVLRRQLSFNAKNVHTLVMIAVPLEIALYVIVKTTIGELQVINLVNANQAIMKMGSIIHVEVVGILKQVVLIASIILLMLKEKQVQ